VNHRGVNHRGVNEDGVNDDGLTDRARYERGMVIRRAVLGAEHVDRSIADTTDFTAPFQDFITRTAWGDIWSRPGLDRQSRSMITLALLTALGQEHELAMHVTAALRNGVTRDQIREVLLHAGVYAGVPAANRAFAISQRVFDGLDQER
jgi:4-carboxymuconolactone decarboxylase